MAALIPSASATGSGTMTLAGPSTNSNQTVTIPDATGTMMVNGPTFSAYQSTQQATLTSNVTTLIQFQTKEWDTGTCFNNTGSTVTLNGISTPQYAFAPNVAGYYQVSSGLAVASSVTYMFMTIYKNGSLHKRLTNTNTASVAGLNGSALIYCNGTSDYLQIYLQQGANQQLVNASDHTYFQAVMVRGE
jgi:hypothetical protein